MRTEALKDAVSMIETNAQSRPSAAEFEMAYQVRVAMDRIRFVIRVVEMSSFPPDLNTEAVTQLADALDRLDAAERRFQDRWRRPPCARALPLAPEGGACKNGSNGHKG